MNGVMNRQQTTNCQERLENALANGLNHESELRIRYRGGSNKVYPVQHNGTVWFYSEALPNRFWNAFGLMNPDENAQNNIVVEINTPFDGIDFSTGAGMFAFDEKGSLWLLHSGRIGGGRPDIGAEVFRRWYLQYDRMEEVDIGNGNVKQAIPVCNIFDEANFLDDLEAFVGKVHIFKRLATRQMTDDPDVLLPLLQEMTRNIDHSVRRTATILTYERNPAIAEAAKLMAEGRCRLCDEDGPFMDKLLGLPFLETHHVKWLSKGGRDSMDNTVALCPNCHRKMHHVSNKEDIAKLKEIAKKQAADIKDEAQWDRAFAASRPLLERLAAEAAEERRSGVTEELDPVHL